MDYPYEVGRLTKQALVQAKAVMVCEHHKDVLLHQGDGQAENVAFNLACIWLKDRVGSFERADVQDSIKNVLNSAVKGECPECARLRNS